MARLSGVSTDSLSVKARRGLSAASVIGLGSILRDQKITCGSIYNTMSRSSNAPSKQKITSSASQTALASSPTNNNLIDSTCGHLNSMEATLDSIDAQLENANLKEEDCSIWSHIDMIRPSSDHMKTSLSTTATERTSFLNHNHAGAIGRYSQGRGHHDVAVLMGLSPHEMNGCGNDYNYIHDSSGHTTYDQYVMMRQSRVSNVITSEGDIQDAGYTSQKYFVQKGPIGSIGNGSMKNLMSESSSSSLIPREHSDGGGPMPIMSTAQKSSAVYGDFLHCVHRQSAPVNVPDWSRIRKEEVCAASKQRKMRANIVEGECNGSNSDVEDGDDRDGRDDDDYDDDDGLEERIPPHELLARERACSEMITFSVCEGHGRTLKGRDMSRVRYAVWKQIGLAD